MVDSVRSAHRNYHVPTHGDVVWWIQCDMRIKCTSVAVDLQQMVDWERRAIRRRRRDPSPPPRHDPSPPTPPHGVTMTHNGRRSRDGT
jgi:hypothetical protein